MAYTRGGVLQQGDFIPPLFPKVFNHLPALTMYQRTEMERTSVRWVAPPYIKTQVRLTDSHQADRSHLTH